MIKAQLVWFNDTDKLHYIYYNTLYLQDQLAVVKPQELKLLTFEMKEGLVPMVKQWSNGNVLISGIDETVVKEVKG